MSARGARSRKDIKKNIEKKEKKEQRTTGKQPQVESIQRPHDAFDWRSPLSSGNSKNTSLGIPSRSVTISSGVSHGSATSRLAEPSSNRPRLDTTESNVPVNLRSLDRSTTSSSRRTSISEDSTGSKEKKKYQAKGKSTSAPRGRGGGVPVKKPTPQSPTPSVFRPESTIPRLSPNSKTWMNFRIWEGTESGLRPYGGFDYDEDMQTGNVLVFFKEEQASDDRPVPQIRCRLEVLQNSGSTWLNNSLLYGRIDDDEDEWTLPGSHQSPTSSRRSHASQAISPNFRYAPTLNESEAYFGVPGSRNFSRNEYYSPPGGPFRPPDDVPTHELWFTAPVHIRTAQAQRLHHVAVRNFLAMLHNKPIVGADLFEMLSTLQAEIQVMYDLDFDERIQMTPRERSIQMITQYLSSHGLDNPRMNIKSALGLLAFAEQDGIRWRQGYIENFVHLAGFLNSQIEESPDFKRLSMGTRRNLTIGAKGIQLQVLEAEEKLSSFDLDMWEETAKTNGNPVYQSYNAFRQFLITHYTKTYGSWPPNHANRDWLNRKVILALQEDFGSLYDYLVNRDVVWDSREERPGKKWMMQHQKNSEDFRADFPELELTDMLVTFDTRHGFEHIPHPYPLLPREVRTSSGEKQTKRKLFGLKKSKGESTRDAKAHLQLSIVFGDATNIERLEASFGGSTLIDAFERFELATDVHRTTPRDARLGRWILLYGILQVLSRLSVDVAGLRFKENVPYFLCADMKRCPEWVTNGHVETIEASQQRSYCWTRSWSTKRTKSEAVELEASSIPLGGELEGVTNLTMLDGTTMQSPIAPLDGPTMLNNDIQRISEKIDELGRIRVHERRIENEKMKREDVVKFPQRNDFRRDDGLQRNNSFCTNDSFRLTESEYQRPLVPVRNPLRSNAGPQGYGSRLEQYPDEKGEWTLG